MEERHPAGSAGGQTENEGVKTIDQMTLAELRAWKPEKVPFEVIQEMVRKMVAVCQPEKIVLFGSYARGEATEVSDLDFLVIMETDLPPTKRSVPLYSALRNYLLSEDIVVYTPAEVEEYSDLPDSFIQTALREGIVLYEKE